MRLLILGGPRFLGRHVVDIALARGHQVTLFNRGRTGPQLYPEVERLRGDRAVDLSPLDGRRWDAVVDTSGFLPGVVGRAIEVLRHQVGHYLFVSSERLVEEAFPGRAAIPRPGLIIGPHDYMDRFPYWVARIAEGGEVLAPGRPDRPVQVLDARDLAAWMVRLSERGVSGIFNATGPDPPLPMSRVLEACREAASSDARFTASWSSRV